MNKLLTTTIIILNLIAFSSYSKAQLLDGPESVVYDTINSCYLVSNANNGMIVSIDESGNQDEFISGLSIPLGIHIHGSILYVSTNEPTMLVGIDLNDPDIIWSMYIPEAIGLSGITTDSSGYLYVADQGGKLIQVDLEDDVYSVLINSGLPGGPQGVTFDPENNRLIIVGFQANSPLVAVNLSDTSVTRLMNTSIGQFIGISRHVDGNYYISSWRTGAVYFVDGSFNYPPELFSGSHSQPTGLYCDALNNVLAVPNFGSNSLDLLPLNNTAIDDTQKGEDSLKPRILSSCPNPFNSRSKIKYSLNTQSEIKLSIYNLLGQKIATLVDEIQEPGEYIVDLNAENMSSGTYFYRITSDYGIESKKILLIK
ncbi:MAG: T9SS type A sorting domain-containing protein [candidate division Zixibacteria bacterium]|nr:T9SS type A sorting domain-containing protein [candidate division Zixibacteria bacterium]